MSCWYYFWIVSVVIWLFFWQNGGVRSNTIDLGSIALVASQVQILILPLFFFNIFKSMTSHTLLFSITENLWTLFFNFPPYILKRTFFLQDNWIRKKWRKWKYISTMKNYKHVSCFRCPECDETVEIIYDHHHAEILCLSCGLIISENMPQNKWLMNCKNKY